MYDRRGEKAVLDAAGAVTLPLVTRNASVAIHLDAALGAVDSSISLEPRRRSSRVSKRPTWSMVKAALEGADAPQLLGLVHELYELDARNREFLHARFVDRAASLDRARKAVSDALFPDPFSKRGVRLREGRQAIRDYVGATGDAAGELDLMIGYIEAGTAFAMDVGYDEDAFFASLAACFPRSSLVSGRCGPTKRSGTSRASSSSPTSDVISDGDGAMHACQPRRRWRTAALRAT